jgi:hypothetical protein
VSVRFAWMSSGQRPFLSLTLQEGLREGHFGICELSTELSCETAEGWIPQGSQGCKDMESGPVYLSLVIP